MRCTVDRYNLSAHADGDELASLAAGVRPRLVALVHGDAGARAALLEKLVAAGHTCIAPQNGATIPLPGRRTTRTPAAPAAPITAEHLATVMRAGSPRHRWTAFELTGRLDGAVRPERLAIVRDLLAADPTFVAGADRPDAYRLLGHGPLAPDEVQACVLALVGAEPATPFVKVSAYPLEGRAEVRFAFPRVAERVYGTRLAALAAETGWRIELRPWPDQGRVQEAAVHHLPAGLAVRGTPSVHLDRGVVVVEATGAATPEENTGACARFAEETGYALVIETPRDAAHPSPTATPVGDGAVGALNLNAKSRLSELAQTLRWPSPRYAVTQHGASHRPTFAAVATIVADGAPLASPSVQGATKKEAEQAAARALLGLLAERGVITATPETAP